MRRECDISFFFSLIYSDDRERESQHQKELLIPGRYRRDSRFPRVTMPTTICTARSTYSPLDDDVHIRQHLFFSPFSFFELLTDSLFKTATQSNAIYEFLYSFETLFFSRWISLKCPNIQRPLLIRLYGDSKVRYSSKAIHQCSTSLINTVQILSTYHDRR